MISFPFSTSTFTFASTYASTLLPCIYNDLNKVIVTLRKSSK